MKLNEFRNPKYWILEDGIFTKIGHLRIYTFINHPEIAKIVTFGMYEDALCYLTQISNIYYKIDEKELKKVIKCW